MDRYGNKPDAKTFKTYLHTPAWVLRLAFPTDRIVLESLSRDFLFDWMSNLTAGSPADVWDMFFMAGDELKDWYGVWIRQMFHEKKCGSWWRKLRAVPARHKRGIPLWD